MTLEAPEQPGLRERKRLATRRAIQWAALTLVDEGGTDAATIDAISAAADVSPRTFFNYFASKDEAMVGDGPTLPATEQLEAFVVAGPRSDVLDDIADLIAAPARDRAHDRELTALRMRVMRANPQLFAIRVLSMHHFEEQLASVVERRLRRDDPQLSDADAATRARLLTHLVSAAMRHAWSTWVRDEHPEPLSDLVHRSIAEMRALLRHA